jgi:hypothetical protein
MTPDAAAVRDSTGVLARRLLARIEQAQVLLDRPPQGGDRATVCAWLSSSDEWRASATRMLTRTFEHEVVAEFMRAVSCSPPRGITARTLEAEQRAVRNGMELLSALHRTQEGRELDRKGRAAAR